MIYSCIMFSDEFQLLDLRLAEELPCIDRIIAVESDCTHSRSPKPAFLSNDPRKAIERLDVQLISFSDPDPWVNEAMQRNTPQRRFADDDVILVSDADEIHRRQDIPQIIDAARNHGFVRIVQHFHYFKINYFGHGQWSRWWLPFAVTGAFLRASGMTFHTLRFRYRGGSAVETNGHHFSYLHTVDGIATKIKAFSHQEYNRSPFTDLGHITERIARGEDLFGREAGRIWHARVIDETFPQAILDDPEKWRDWIAPCSDGSLSATCFTTIEQP